MLEAFVSITCPAAHSIMLVFFVVCVTLPIIVSFLPFAITFNEINDKHY